MEEDNMRIFLIKSLLLIAIFMISACNLNVKVSATVPPIPPLFVPMTPLLINSGEGLTNGVTSIMNPSGGSYQIAYNNSDLFYTSGNAISSNTIWYTFPLSNLGDATIVATSPYYLTNNIPQLLILTSNNQLWVCSNLNTAGLTCTQNASSLPSTLPTQNLTNILGNGGISYAVLNNTTLMMSLSGNNYQLMPNIPAMPNNTAITATTVDMFGNLYVVFNSSTIGPVLYEFNINNKKWSLILQNDQLTTGVIAVDAGHNIYFLNTSSSNGSCVSNQVNFNIQYVSGNSLASQRMSFNGCNSPITLNTLSIDANSEVYVSLENGNIAQVAYNNGNIIY